jgi:uncharacterized protein
MTTIDSVVRGVVIAMVYGALGAPAAASEIGGVVSWDTLGKVQLVREKDRYVPRYADAVLKLDAKEVQLQGFMMPLTVGEKQTHFVLSANPSECGFCMPGGPESLVEVKAKSGVKYTLDPVVLKGRLEVLKDEPTGLFYRLVDAAPAK